MANKKDRFFKHRVLEEIAVDLSKAYAQTLRSLNQEITKILGGARGVSKSEFFVIPEEDTLLKAGRGSRLSMQGGMPTEVVDDIGPGPKNKAPSAPAPKQQGPREIKAPGSRGGKWWRDKKGVVRYGERPKGRERGWSEMEETEVANLYSNVEAVFEYSFDLQDALDQALVDAGFNDGAGNIIALIREARDHGMSAEDWFALKVEEAGEDPDVAREMWGDVTRLVEEALQDPKMKRKAKQAIKDRERIELRAEEGIKRSSSYIPPSFDKEILEGDTKTVALKLLGLFADIDALFLPTRAGETGETNYTEARRSLGRVTPNGVGIGGLTSRASDMTPAQVAGLFVLHRLNDTWDHEEGGEFMRDGEFTTVKPDDESLDPIIEKALSDLTGVEDLSDAEFQRVIRRFNEIGHHVKEYIDAFNNDQGGEEIGMIFDRSYNARDMFRRKTLIRDMEQSLADRKQMIEDALAAQEDANIETPEAIRFGFRGLTAKLQAEGRLEPGKEADLTDYQKQAINWMSKIKRGILGYDTGMGKTPISIGLMAKLMEEGKAKRGIMVMPKGLMPQWPKEIKAFFPDAKVVSLGEGMSLEDRLEMIEAIRDGHVEADFVIMSASTVGFTEEARERLRQSGIYEQETDDKGKDVWKLAKGVTQEQHIAVMEEIAKTDRLAQALRSLDGAVFFDEAHHETQGLKTPDNRSRIVAKEFLGDREYSFLLTATPMPNGDPAELFNLMDLVHPGSAGPDVHRFANKVASYEQVYDDETGKLKWELSANHDWEKASKDVAPFVFMKKKTDADVVAANEKAGMKLPALHATTHELWLPDEISELFEQAGDIKPVYHDESKHGRWKTMEELGKGGRLRAIGQMQALSVSPKILLGDSYTGPQPKIDHLADLVQKHFHSPENHDRPMIVFSQFPRAFEYAKEELAKRGVDTSLTEVIDGTKDAGDRDVIQEAANSGRLKVVFVSVRAGGAGLNLQKKSNKMVFLDEPWTPAHKDQALGRVHRTGNPHKNVESINIKLAGSMDQAKLQRMAEKVMTIESMSYMKDGGEVASKIAGASLVKLLGGEDWASSRSKEEIQAELERLGFGDETVTSEALQGKFEIKKFADTIDFKSYLDFGDQEIEARQQLADMRLATGKIDKETHAKQTAKNTQDRMRWAESVYRMGQRDIIANTPAPKDPEPTYKLLPKKAPDGLSESAQRLLNTMAREKGSFAISDYINNQLFEDMVKDHPDKTLSDKERRLDVGAQFHKNRASIRKEVEKAFRELERKGVLARTDSVAGEIAEREAAKTAPKKTTQAKKAPAKAKAKTAPKAKATKTRAAAPKKASSSPAKAKKAAPKGKTKAAPKKTATKAAAKKEAPKTKGGVKYDGGWSFGDRKTINAIGDEFERDVARIVARSKPKTYDDMLQVFFGDEEPDHKEARQWIRRLHKLGVLS